MSTLGNLDRLLPVDTPHATFHDARLICVSHDDAAGALIADWAIPVGDPHAVDPAVAERHRSGRLTLEGLAIWSSDQMLTPGAWLTSFGSLAEAGTPASDALASQVAPGALAGYLYFSDTNSFAYFAAASARFEWLD